MVHFESRGYHFVRVSRSCFEIDAGRSLLLSRPKEAIESRLEAESRLLLPEESFYKSPRVFSIDIATLLRLRFARVPPLGIMRFSLD